MIGTSALIKETQRALLVPSTVRGHSQKAPAMIQNLLQLAP